MEYEYFLGMISLGKQFYCSYYIHFRSKWSLEYKERGNISWFPFLWCVSVWKP